MKFQWLASAAVLALVAGTVAAPAQMSSPTAKEPVPGAGAAPSEGQMGTSPRRGAQSDTDVNKGRNAQREGTPTGRTGGEQRGAAERPATGADSAAGAQPEQRTGETTGRPGTGTTAQQPAERRSGSADENRRRQQSDSQRDQGRAGQRTEQGGAPKDQMQRTETPGAPGSQRRDRAQTPGQEGTGAATERTRRETESGERTGAAPDNQPGGRAGTAGTAGSETRTSATISEDRQQRVVDVLSRQRSAEVRDVNISVSIGTTLPPRVRPRPLPREVISIVPEYRNYDYVVVRDEIVIVEPRTRRVVHVMPRSQARRGTVATQSGSVSSTALQLPPEKRRMIRETVMRNQDRTVQLPSGMRIIVGETVPETIVLRELPDTILTEVPEIRSYEYFVRDDDVVLIDRRERRIVDVIE
jgi:hypothetical protein